MSSDEIDTLRINPEVIEAHAKRVNVADLTLWEGHPVDYDVGAATVYASTFGSPDLVYTFEGQVMLGKAQVEAETIEPKDGGEVMALELSDIGWDKDRAIAMAVGKLTEHKLGLWDDTLTAEIVTHLREVDESLADAAGWDGDTLDELIDRLEFDAPPDDEPDDLPAPEAPVTSTGDLWTLGDHYLTCGDCRSVPLPMGDVAFVTDPPYGINVVEARKGMPGQAKFDPIEGDGDDRLAAWVIEAAEGSTAVLFGANNWPHLLPTPGVWACWDKRLTVEADRMFGSPFELAWVGGSESAEYVMVRVLHGGVVNADDPGQPRSHPTAKPVDVMATLIDQYVDPVNMVVEPFAGSGSTLLACERLGRRCFAVEVSARYCDVIAARWQAMTGQVPVLNGEPHDFTAGTPRP